MNLRISLISLLVCVAPVAFAQDGPNAPPCDPATDPECFECFPGSTNIECGTPDQTGGGSSGGGGSILVNNTDIGDAAQFDDDVDDDGISDFNDNCPFIKNPAQSDRDDDGRGDVCDNAPDVQNADQLDTDGDGEGDVIDADKDGDGVLNGSDNCELFFNPTQTNTDASFPGGDALGDVCDDNDDNDEELDATDPCPKIPGVTDTNSSACRNDEDGDGRTDAFDNCPGVANDDQIDTDTDGLGDACDVDIDNDGIFNTADNAPLVKNPDQEDLDRDGVGDVADSEFCYVYSISAACLNPLDTFSVGAKVVGPDSAFKVGDELKLRLFSNRVDAAIQFTWVVDGRPVGSDAVVQNAQGKVTRSAGGFEYVYGSTSESPAFRPDVGGDFKLKLQAELIFPDDVFVGGKRIATITVPLTVDGEAAGCSATDNRSTLGSLLIVLGAALVLRRRRVH